MLYAIVKILGVFVGIVKLVSLQSKVVGVVDREMHNYPIWLYMLSSRCLVSGYSSPVQNCDPPIEI